MLAKVSAQASHGTCSMDPIFFFNMGKDKIREC